MFSLSPVVRLTAIFNGQIIQEIILRKLSFLVFTICIGLAIYKTIELSVETKVQVDWYGPGLAQVSVEVAKGTFTNVQDCKAIKSGKTQYYTYEWSGDCNLTVIIKGKRHDFTYQ